MNEGSTLLATAAAPDVERAPILSVIGTTEGEPKSAAPRPSGAPRRYARRRRRREHNMRSVTYITRHACPKGLRNRMVEEIK